MSKLQTAQAWIEHLPRSLVTDVVITDIHLPTLFFTEIRMIESIPVGFREEWERTNEQVYSWVEEVVPGSREYDCALFWEFLLHKLLLRASPRPRGQGRPNKDTLSVRFKVFEEGDYLFLVNGLETTCRVAVKKRQVTHPEGF